MPLPTAATTRTGSASSPRSGSPASPWRTGALFPPDDNDAGGALWLTFLRRLIARLNPVRRRRAAPRVIKRKMPKWHVKRADHASWPQPLQQPEYTTVPPLSLIHISEPTRLGMISYA